MKNGTIMKEIEQYEDMRQKYSENAIKWHFKDLNGSTVKLLIGIQMA